MIWIVIPARNEEKTIGLLLRKVKSLYRNIVVVDDGSKDNTAKIAKKNKAIVLKHIVNLGKGAALKTGCDYAVRKGADIIVTLDADGQHKPEDIKRFLSGLKGKDIVFGTRQLNKSMPFILRIGNMFINRITAMMYHISLDDTQCGFRAFRANAYKKIRWKSSDYSMESEMIANAGKKCLKYAQLPIKTIYHDKYKGTTVLDGIKIVTNMFLWKFRR